MASTTKGSSKSASKPAGWRNAAPQAAAPKQEDVDAQLEVLRHQSITRAREALRVKVLPTLESAILMVPSGNVRNRLTNANVLLLKALEELQA